ncbi:peptide chain release factor N(5)-glutamine methyltransferase [uncultured Duncaniella sp.]|uniref:peptide chain release factor N(5)-glutamine methyltransferase n=1 Tax=uncultured Duncaniella sp. TaxID=2768039 RepID=UPI00272F5254|nr:peptide chain release factor N(5)-glutamine methyltransferase [uncultured Duncaniella sp.]
MTTLRQLSDSTCKKLAPIYGDREARWLFRTIMEHIKGWNQVELALRADKEVSDFIVGRVDDATDRLLEGEPVQYIYGDTYWHGMTLKVNPAVLIPRPETEELVDIIVKDNTKSDLKVLDVCTGSGCIAVALARSLDFPEVSGFDISDDALAVARENASALKVDVNFFKADALNLSKVENEFDIIVSNPPYVLESEKAGIDKNVLDHEPHVAIFVPDDDGLKFYKAIASYAKTALIDNGRLYFEVNPLTSSQLKSWMESEGWKDVNLLPDMYGKTRFLIAEK